MTQGQDMDQPFADNSGTTEVGPMTPQASPCQTKSGMVIKETAPYHRSFGLVAWEILLDQDEQVKYPTAISQYELQKKIDHPLAFAATTNPDILYAHEAMKAPDEQKFIDAMEMETELSQHETRGNFVPVKKEDIPPGNKLIDMMCWSMRRKERSTLKKSTSGKCNSMCMEDSRNIEYTIGRLMHQLLHGRHSESS